MPRLGQTPGLKELLNKDRVNVSKFLHGETGWAARFYRSNGFELVNESAALGYRPCHQQLPRPEVGLTYRPNCELLHRVPN